MGKFVVDLCLDGYENKDDQEKAELIFIQEQLNISASSVSVKKLDDYLEENK